ncbi:MAG: phosphoglucosamine mutase [Bacillus subtilis]|nr:phosphoglucosamine mutase [Bacillus subtilis]
MPKYFGTDGIRGEAGTFLTAELATRVGESLSVLHASKVVIGMDTRESGPLLAKGIEEGALSVGVDVLHLGIVPTPVLAFVAQELKCFGVMITASHNPFQDNGIKIFDAGKKLFLNDEAQLEAVLNHQITINQPASTGKILPKIDVFPLYYQLFLPFLRKTSKRIGLDFANGATYLYGPRVFQTILDHPVILGNQPDGKNINLGVGSTHLEALQAVVRDHQLDYGFAFDGDGDRVLVVDRDLSIIDGDQLIYLIACHLKRLGQLRDNTVVLTKMSNLGIIKALERQGIAVITTDVGDKYVIDALDQFNYSIGGENSGHIINRALLNTGDGVLNAAYLIHILEDIGSDLKTLLADILMFPDRLENIRGVDRALAKHPEVIEAVATIQRTLGTNGKILVRASGTEPLLRISVSAPTIEEVNRHIQTIATIIHRLSSPQEGTL